ncbi:MAG: hypothetical protein QM725_18230 [Lacibacter sp.]
MKKQVSVKSPFSKAALHYKYIKKEHVTAQPFERGAVLFYGGKRFGLERAGLYAGWELQLADVFLSCPTCIKPYVASWFI